MMIYSSVILISVVLIVVLFLICGIPSQMFLYIYLIWSVHQSCQVSRADFFFFLQIKQGWRQNHYLNKQPPGFDYILILAITA